ncbi:helix-turn-helix domain-containing protein [Tepidibacter hydrothermalis]|uniref:AraC family transcriptional regulator n=1 Tax=Tepidibacter hydrothermalis TaxID=3036126 RepID=A0ABY8EDZ1_9FIRM|nr:AraC family transcriptional regulator [Tepidibacter hydrothermalis]WFD09702.1 AraC family transcriptional regulator [Tepidibacter hydrothermalis]
MKTKKDVLDKYFNYIEDKYCSKTSEEFFCKKYTMKEQLSQGNLIRIKIEDGLEISKLNIQSEMEIELDNTDFKAQVLEVGYCYEGYVEVLMLPNNKKHTIKSGEVFIYKMANDVEYFKFKYVGCKIASVSMNFNLIKGAINPIWENQLMIQWDDYLDTIFKGNTIVVQKSSYNIQKIAEDIESISLDNMIGYMNIKLKTIEFLSNIIDQKYKQNSINRLKDDEVEIFDKAKKIIDINIENAPTINVLANNLDISVYRLQKIFKDITGDTVYEYIKKERVEKAKYLLNNTDMKIIEIAIEVGYENPSKFSNIFKRYNGITPLKYRKLNTNNN